YQRRGLGSDAARGNDRSLKGGSSLVIRSGGGIVDIQAEAAHVARPLGERRHTEQNAAAGIAARSLVVAKVEQFIFFDRASDRSSELIPLRDRNQPAVRPEDRQRLCERVARL